MRPLVIESRFEIRIEGRTQQSEGQLFDQPLGSVFIKGPDLHDVACARYWASVMTFPSQDWPSLQGSL